MTIHELAKLMLAQPDQELPACTTLYAAIDDWAGIGRQHAMIAWHTDGYPPESIIIG